MKIFLRTSTEPEPKPQSRTAQIAFDYLDPGLLLNSESSLLFQIKDQIQNKQHAWFSIFF